MELQLGASSESTMNQSSNHIPRRLSGPEDAVPDMTLPEQQDLLNLKGFIRTIDFVPTAKPKGFSDQVYIVTAGGSSRAYFYDTNPGTLGWKYTALT